MSANDLTFLLIAGGLHIALPVAAAVLPHGEGGSGRVLETQVISEIEIAYDAPRSLPVLDDPRDDGSMKPPDPDDARVAMRTTDTRDDTPRRAVRRRARAASEVPSGDPNGGGTTVDVNPIPDPDGKAKPGEFTMPPADFNAPPGIAPQIGIGPGGPGAPPVWATQDVGGGDTPRHSPPAPTTLPKRKTDPKRATKILREGMKKKDRRLGLDLPAASAIASVIVGAVRSSDAPYDCRGTLVVTLSGAGKVTNVALSSFSGGDASTWKFVQNSSKSALASRSFIMKAGFEKGAVVTVTAVSKKKSVSGGTGKLGITSSFDITNIGAKATRVVSRSISVRAIE